jgi:hypothetical protein
VTRPSPQHSSEHSKRLLDRLNRIGEVLRDRGDAVALLGLGSVGRDLHRLDEHSDLDFFAVVDDEAKGRYLNSVDWLQAAAAVAFSFPNTADGRKVLFADGLYAEYAVFIVTELREAEYPPARLVWQREDAPAGLDLPMRHPDQERSNISHQVNEAMTNLFVGLHRELRGERLSAMRLIQVHAVDRILHVLELSAEDGVTRQDPFARERGVEFQHRARDLPLAAMVAGYRHNGEAAMAVLTWLQRHCTAHLDPALLAVVEDLLEEVEHRSPDRETEEDLALRETSR